MPKAPAEPLLHFYLAILNIPLKRPQAARPHFLTAQAKLRKVAKLENEIFQTIEKRLAESKS